MNRVLLLGGSGILGSEVRRQLKLLNFDHVAPRSSELDVKDKELLQVFIRDFKPNWIVNCAAWTDVDGAEESFEAAIALNESAVRNIAEVALEIKCQIIHISTDYVFDGNSSVPYNENMKEKPLNRYGESKLRGERVLLELIPKMAYVIRTSWLYGVEGKNFVKSIAKKAVGNESVRVVNDQVGSPTSARNLAEAITSIISHPPKAGIYNFSSKGSCSWYDLARTIYKEAGADPEMVQKISSTALNLKAKRPIYSLLSKEKWDSTGLSHIPEWKTALRLMLPEILNEIRLLEKL